jgi:hypothetical protein
VTAVAPLSVAHGSEPCRSSPPPHNKPPCVKCVRGLCAIPAYFSRSPEFRRLRFFVSFAFRHRQQLRNTRTRGSGTHRCERRMGRNALWINLHRPVDKLSLN